jgi:hypothetical protein
VRFSASQCAAGGRERNGERYREPDPDEKNLWLPYAFTSIDDPFLDEIMCQNRS